MLTERAVACMLDVANACNLLPCIMQIFMDKSILMYLSLQPNQHSGGRQAVSPTVTSPPKPTTLSSPSVTPAPVSSPAFPAPAIPQPTIPTSTFS